MRDPDSGEVGFNLELGGYFSIKRNVMSIRWAGRRVGGWVGGAAGVWAGGWVVGRVQGRICVCLGGLWGVAAAAYRCGDGKAAAGDIN